MNEILDKNLDEIHDQEVEIVNHLHHPRVVVCDRLTLVFLFFSSINFISLDHDHEGGNRSMDEDEDDDDASVSDRSSQGSASMTSASAVRWDYRVMNIQISFQ